MFGGQQSGDSGGFTEVQPPDGPKGPNSKPDPESPGLSRCAGCYNPEGHSMFLFNHDSDSSEYYDSGPEEKDEDSDDSEESDSMSHSSTSETYEKPAADQNWPGCGLRDGDRPEPMKLMETLEETKKREEERPRAPLVKSVSLPSPSPSLRPLSSLARPPRVISTLRVFQSKHNGTTCFSTPIFTCRHPSKDNNGEDGREARKEAIDSLWPPQMFLRPVAQLPGQHSMPTLQHQHHGWQHQPPNQLPHHPHLPLTAPPHTLPVSHPLMWNMYQHVTNSSQSQQHTPRSSGHVRPF